MNATQILRELVTAREAYAKDADLEALAIRLLESKDQLVKIGDTFGRLHEDFRKAVAQYNEIINSLYCDQYDQGVEHLRGSDCNSLNFG